MMGLQYVNKPVLVGLVTFIGVFGFVMKDASAGTKYHVNDLSEGIKGKARQCALPAKTLDISVNAGHYSRLSLIAVEIKQAYPLATIIKYRRIDSSTLSVKFLAWPDKLPLCFKIKENGKGH